MAATQTDIKRWPAPRKIRWAAWLACYVLALTLNRHYAPRLAEILALEKLTPEQSWWLGVAPALVLVTLALLLRWCWYQGWLIYHRANELIYTEKVRQNQQYWTETALLQEVIFCCGALRDIEEFNHYYVQQEEGQNAPFDPARQKMVFPAQRVAIQSRLQGILLHLAKQLKQRKYLSENHHQFLWLWLGDEASWQLFRLQAQACGGECPVQPDRYVKGCELNWLIDRAQEGHYQQILLLGYECQENLELYLALVFSAKGEMAQVGRGFSLTNWAEQQPSFVAALRTDMTQLQLCTQVLDSHEVQAWVQDKHIAVSTAALALPAAFQQAGATRSWLWLLCVLDDLKSSTVIIQEQNQLLTVSQVRAGSK